MKNPVLPKIVLILLVILFGSCSARKSMISAGKSYEIGEHYNAIEKYRKAYRSQKVGQEKAEMAFRIAESYFDLSEFAKASIWYKNAIKRNYSEPKCMLHYADCLRAVQKYEDAIIWYQTYLSVKPGDQFAENGLEASKVVREWLDQPNRYIVNIVLSLIHISEPTRLGMISYAVFCLKK